MAIKKAIAVGAVSAGLVFAGFSVAKLMGTPSMYGDDPMSPPSGNQQFAPKIFTVVYMKMVQGTLQAQHGYFNYSSTGNPDVLGVVNRFRNNSWTGGTAPLPIDGKIRDAFQDFGFRQQSKVYIIFDTPGVNIVTQRPLYFTEYGANDPLLMTKLDKNKSFYNAKSVSFGDPNIQAIYVENWFRDNGGKPIPDDPIVSNDGSVGQSTQGATAKVMAKRPKITKYSINFSYRIPSATNPSASIPIAIDPDTGNGYDEPPP
jgi:hypothetical protein